MDGLPIISSPVLSTGLLARIHELNRDYVELLVAEHALAPGSHSFPSLSRQVLAGLAALEPAARNAIAAAPYSLYSLGFENGDFCRSALAPAPLEPVFARYGAVAAAHLQAPFCEVALFFAWHVASSQNIAARVLYAMPDAIAARLVALPLWHLKRLAVDCAGLLMPRWPTNPRFWPDLIRFARAADARRLGTAQLLGSQLIAAELEAAASVAGTRKKRSKLPKSPRLRATRPRTVSTPR